MENPDKNKEVQYKQIAENSSLIGLKLFSSSEEINKLNSAINSNFKYSKSINENISNLQNINADFLQKLNLNKNLIFNTKSSVLSSKEGVGKTIKDIFDLINDYTLINEELKKSATILQKVKVSINDINSINSNIKLLSLNAAIEANKAADNGKGFTVIASEVKSLAQQTASITNNIQTALHELINEMEGLTANSTQSADFSNESKRLADLLNNKFDRITYSISAISSKFNIATDTYLMLSNRIKENSRFTMNNLNELEEKLSVCSHSASTLVSNMKEVANDFLGIINLSLEITDQTEDAIILKEAKNIASKITDIFNSLINEKKISEQDLFDKNYQLIKDSNPEQ